MDHPGLQNVGGAKKPKWDPRHFSEKKKFGSIVSLSTQDFDVWTPLATKDQQSNQLCTDYAATGAAEGQFGVVLDECFQRAAHNVISKTPGYTGPADIWDAMRASIKVGALATNLSPFIAPASDPTTDTRFADIKNYPSELVFDAGTRKEVSVYATDTQSDLFDSMRDSMWRNLQAGFKSPVVTGTAWRASWLSTPGGVITTENPNEASSGHAFVIVGQKTINGTLYLKAHLSSGTKVGDNGFFYFPRAIVNRFYGGFSFGPGDPKDYQTNLWNILQKLYNSVYKLFQQNKTAGFPPPPKYLWETPQNARHSVRVICDEEALTWNDKNILCACVQVESGFNPKAVGPMNKNGTRDFGICQFNDGTNKQGVPYWIGPGAAFASTDEVLMNPEKCVRLMARQFKAGNAKLWSSFNSGAYKRFL